MEQMAKMGDVASSTGKGFDQLAEAVLDASTGEFERLKEFGITAKKHGDQVRFSFKGISTEVAFSDRAITNYIQGLGNMNGVMGASDAIMKTTGGGLSNMKDTITALYLKIGNNLKPAISGVISGLTSAVGVVSSFIDWLGTGTTGVKAFAIGVAVIGGAMLTYGIITGALTIQTAVLTGAQWLLNAAMTANPVALVVVAIGALVAGVVVAYNQLDTFRATVDGAWSSLKVIASNIKGTFTEIPDLIIKAFTQIPKAIMSAFSGISDLFSAIFSGDFKAIPEIVAKLGKDLLKSNPITGLAMNVGESLTKAPATPSTMLITETMTKAEKDKKTKSATAGFKSKVSGSSVAPATEGKGLKAGISEVRSSAPKNFYISIGNLVKDLNINTTNLSQGSAKIKEEITKLLLTSVNDMQIISE
jgi:hypothetical protein